MILALLLRTILIYFVIFLVMRLMGKREIGKLSVFDLVIFIMMAEIAVFVIEDIHKPLMDGLVPIVTLLLIQVTIAWLALHSRKIRHLFDGKPSFLIRSGKLDREEMRKQRYNLDDLMLQLRQSKVLDVSDVEFAILEPSGKLTVLEKEHMAKYAETSAEVRDPHDTVRFEGLPMPLIMDGKVQDENLQKLGKTRFWLKNRIQEKGVHDFKDVFFCSVDQRGRFFLDRKH